MARMAGAGVGCIGGGDGLHAGSRVLQACFKSLGCTPSWLLLLGGSVNAGEAA